MPTSIYVHVPFCASRCRYCNFYSGEPKAAINDYARFVLSEAKLRRDSFPDREAQTLYIGGGTPSLLGVGRLAGAIAGIQEIFVLSRNAEVTVEVNPSSALNFRALMEAGVNRVSVGVQALQDSHLQTLGRSHSANEARKTVEAAAAEGLSVSADLMYGYSGLSVADLLSSAKALVDAGAGHISAYSLEVGGRCSVEKGSEQDEEDEEEALSDYLTAEGFARYEVSSYALPGRESRHNTGYWVGWGYMGLGPGAHGFLPQVGEFGQRYANRSKLADWRAAIMEGKIPPGEIELPSASEALLERLFLALRRSAPFNPAKISTDPRVEAAFRKLAQAGDIELTEEGLYRVTGTGLRRADGLAAYIHSMVYP